MALSQVSKSQCEEAGLIVEKFSKIDENLTYTDTCSVPLLKAAKEYCEESIDERNAIALTFDAATEKAKDAQKKLAKIMSSFLLQTGEKYTKDSDEYVWAGGTRQSEVIEKAKQTRLENAKTEAEKMEAEVARLKAEAARLQAEIEKKKVEAA